MTSGIYQCITITYFIIIPLIVGVSTDVALVEYIGTFPERKTRSSTKSENAPAYIRAKPYVGENRRNS